MQKKEKKESLQIHNITCEICGEFAFEGPETQTAWDMKTAQGVRRKQIYHRSCLDAKEETE